MLPHLVSPRPSVTTATYYLVDDLFVESLESFAGNSFEGPDLVSTLGNLKTVLPMLQKKLLHLIYAIYTVKYIFIHKYMKFLMSWQEV
jgi:hypothetical protein